MLGKRLPKDGLVEPPLKLVIQLGGGPDQHREPIAPETYPEEPAVKVSQLDVEAGGEGPSKDWNSSFKKKKEGLKATGNNAKNKEKGDKKTEEEEREEKERAFQKEQEELDKKLALQENRVDLKKKRCWERRWVRNLNVRDYSDDIWLTKWVRVSDSKLKTMLSKTPFKIEPPKIFKCTFDGCEKVFFDAPSLKKHSSTHGERMFICTVKGCNKKFLDNSKLRRHQVVHTGERPFKCEICGKKFSLDFNLRTHLRTHTGVKPYVCKFPKCGKRFLQSSNLANHEKTHLKEKNHGNSSAKNGGTNSNDEHNTATNEEMGTNGHIEEEGELAEDDVGLYDEDSAENGAAGEGLEEGEDEDEQEEDEEGQELDDQEIGVAA